VTPTPTLEAALRSNLEEVIPPGGTESDTMFSNAEVDALLTSAGSVEEASWLGWTKKAIRLFKPGTLVSARVGNESYQFIGPADARKAALEMAEFFRNLIPVGTSVYSRGVSVIAGTQDPDVLGDTNGRPFAENWCRDDISRLGFR
jgi:hypothetical protein